MRRLSIGAAVLLVAVVLSTGSAFAGEGQTPNLTEEAEKLRVKAWAFNQEQNPTAALQALGACADIMAMKEYTSSNKNTMIQMLNSQFGSIASAFFTKRDWAGAENAYRKKMAFMERFNQTETNDYQTTLQSLEIALRAQKKSTESASLLSKMKPLKKEADPVLPPAVEEKPEDSLKP